MVLVPGGGSNPELFVGLLGLSLIAAEIVRVRGIWRLNHWHDCVTVTPSELVIRQGSGKEPQVVRIPHAGVVRLAVERVDRPPQAFPVPECVALVVVFRKSGRRHTLPDWLGLPGGGT